MPYLIVKTVHLLMVAVGVGAIIAELLLIVKFRRTESNVDRRASENMALFISKRIEFPALAIALLTGFVMLTMVEARPWLSMGFMHAKILLAVLLVGLTHVGMSSLRKMNAAAAAQDEVAVSNAKKRFLMFSGISAVFVVIIFFFIVAKPF